MYFNHAVIYYRNTKTYLEPPVIDLHTHSTASDGSDTPSQILQKAASLGLTAVALCDHDTVDGLKEFTETAPTLGIRAVPGIEISTRLYNKEVHILGLFIDPAAPSLRETLDFLRGTRSERNAKLLECLQRSGFAITEEEVRAVSGGGEIGRPHFARILVKKGYFATNQECFKRCIGPQSPCYIPRRFLPTPESIRAVREAGGIAIWAHPLTSASGDRSFLRKFLRQMVPMGLEGLEGYYAQFTPRQEGIARSVAAELGLQISGGSDYHGANQPGVALGTGKGNLAIPDEVYENLVEYQRRRDGKI